jgi:type I restriction enzyme, S subunit
MGEVRATASSDTWESTPIGEVVSGLYDGPHATPKPASDGPVFLGIKNITEDGRLDLSEIRHISEEDFPRWTRRVLPQPGDIVFTYEATLNRYAVIPEGFRGCLGRRLALIRPNPRKVDTRFLFYYFFGDDWRRIISNNMLSRSTVDRIPLASFPNFEISLPPLSTQRKIAAVLSAYDGLIENNIRRVEILQEMARAIYREWFVNFRFPGHEKVRMVDSEQGPIPEGWEVKPVAHFGRAITGKTPSKKVPDYYGEYMPFIKTPDMHGSIFCTQTSERLSQSGVESQKTKTLPANSICVSCIGTVGIVSITSQPSQTNQQINSLVLRDQSEREFLYFSLLGLKDTIIRFGATGATMANLSKGKFEGLRVISPTKELTTLFHETVSLHFEQIKVLQLKQANLRRTRDLLLPRLISGEVDVEGLEIRAAAPGP